MSPRILKIAVLGTSLASTLIAGPAQACTHPAAKRGQIVYNADYRVMQYCANSGWMEMGVRGPASTGCTAPTALPGTMLYNKDDHVAQFCAGSQWSAMGPVPGAGGSGCTNPAATEGRLLFNSDYDVLQYCDGSNWVAVGKPTLGPPDVTNGLLAWYLLDDGTGGTATDSTPVSHDGTLMTGPTWTTGMVGGALGFDGTASYVDIPFVPAFNLTGDLTLSAWINATTTAGPRRIIALPRSAAVGSEQYGLMLNGGALQLWLGATSFGDNSISASYSFTGTWHHVAATVSGTVMTLYIDGVAATTVLRLSANAARNITGLAGGADGRLLVIVNVGTTNALTLKNASASSSAANRFCLTADLPVPAYYAVQLIYDASATCWRHVH